MKIEWTKLIPALVTILALVAVFLVGKFAPDDLAVVTELVEEIQPLLITVILAIVGKNIVDTYSRAKVEAAELQQVAEMECAKMYSQADAQATAIPKAG